MLDRAVLARGVHGLKNQQQAFRVLCVQLLLVVPQEIDALIEALPDLFFRELPVLARGRVVLQLEVLAPGDRERREFRFQAVRHAGCPPVSGSSLHPPGPLSAIQEAPIDMPAHGPPSGYGGGRLAPGLPAGDQARLGERRGVEEGCERREGGERPPDWQFAVERMREDAVGEFHVRSSRRTATIARTRASGSRRGCGARPRRAAARRRR